MLMKPATEVITNTQSKGILHTSPTGGEEYHLILCILVYPGTNNFCEEVETAWLEILEAKFKYTHKSQGDLRPPRGCSHKGTHDQQVSYFQ